MGNWNGVKYAVLVGGIGFIFSILYCLNKEMNDPNIIVIIFAGFTIIGVTLGWKYGKPKKD